MRATLGSRLLPLLVSLLFAPAAGAVTINFDCLTGNDLGDCAIGEAQLQVEVSDLGGGSVRFHFKNLGPLPSVISEVYFDDGSLLDLSTLIDGPGVSFVQDASPPDLPGGEEAVPPFQVTEGFLAEATPSPAMNGVGPSEWVQIDFTLQGGQDFADVIAELTNGDLRIGIRAIAFASGGSESFINVPVPEPGTAALLCLGLVGLAARRRHPRAGTR